MAGMMRCRFTPLSLSMMAALAVAGCGRHDGTAAGTTLLRLGGPPVASIGVVDGDTLQTLSALGGVTEDRRGYVYVVQRLVPYVAVFDSTGRRVATLGRGGGGPGEFAVPTRVSFAGDSVWITDASLQKFSLFGADFSHVRDVIIASEYADLAAVLDGGSRVSPGAVSAYGFAVELRRRDIWRKYFQPWAGEPAELASYRAAEQMTQVVVDGRGLSVIPPIVEIPFVIARDSIVLFVERREAPALTRLNRDGSPARTVRLAIGREAVPDSTKRKFLERISAILAGTREKTFDALDAAIELPDTSAFIKSAQIDVDGRWWVRQAVPGKPVQYHQIAPDGSVSRTLSVPDGMAAVSFRNDRVWVSVTDDNDVPFLRRYRMEAR